MTITRCRRRFVLRFALFAVGAGPVGGLAAGRNGKASRPLLRRLRGGCGVLVLILILILVLARGCGRMADRILVRSFLARLVLARLVLVRLVLVRFVQIRGRPHVHFPA